MRLFLSGLFTLLAITAAVAAPSIKAGQAATKLGRGVNVLGYDPLWTDAGKARFKPAYYKMLHDSGFQNIRVNLQAFSHMDQSGHLDAQWLAKLDDVVKQATGAGLKVILDEHDYRACAENAEDCRSKLIAFWNQIAPRYEDEPDSVLFEILNEPNKAITPDIWNGLLREALTVIRKTNPDRSVVIGPANSNNFHSLDKLSLPEDDRNIIVTVHYYDPFAFTHQGATWTNPSREKLIGVKWGSPAEHEQIVRDFSTIAAWSRNHDRPILLGEFGAYDKGDIASRAAWTASVARAAESNHFAWSYWQFEGSFGAYDVATDKWMAPIHQALTSSQQN